VASYRRLQLEQTSRIKASVSEHEKILRAIQEGLPEEADRLLQVHILNLGGELRRIFSVVSASQWQGFSEDRESAGADIVSFASVAAK